LLLLAVTSALLQAQSNSVLTLSPPEKLTIKRGGTAEVKLKAQLQPGYHANSNAPADEFLIPMKLTWANGPLQTEQITYPKPQFEKFAFSANPVSIFSGNFEIATRFKAPANATPGLAMMTGKLRFQACNDRECLPPRTIDVRFTLDLQ
jgi:hypothetical protein